MKLYNYDRISKIFTEITEARKDPLVEGRFLIPACATTIEPPQIKDNEILFFDNGNWVVKLNRIGQYYYEKNGTKVVIREFDIDIPDYALQIDPPDEFHTSHDGTEWILDENKKQIQKNLDEKSKFKETSEINNMSIDEINNFIDSMFETSETIDELKTTVVEMFKKILPLI